MSFEDLRQSLPEWAKDIKLNSSSVFNQPELSPVQLWGSALASVLTVGYAPLIEAIEAEAAEHLSPDQVTAVRGAVALMSMNNIYYRFVHLSGDEGFVTLPAKLRMNFMRSHGVAKELFELWCLVISAINGCGMCIESHVKQLLSEGASREEIAAATRVGAVMHAMAKVLTVA